jgi:hypothetical protein
MNIQVTGPIYRLSFVDGEAVWKEADTTSEKCQQQMANMKKELKTIENQSLEDLRKRSASIYQKEYSPKHQNCFSSITSLISRTFNYIASFFYNRFSVK